MGTISAFLDGGNQDDILQGDYDINYDDEGSINDIDYANVNFTSNTNDDLFSHLWRHCRNLF